MASVYGTVNSTDLVEGIDCRISIFPCSCKLDTSWIPGIGGFDSVESFSAILGNRRLATR